MPHLLLAGAPTGCWTNLGDEAILAGMVDALRAAIPGVRLTVVSSSPPGTHERYGCQAVRFDDLPALASAVAGCDLLVLGGGSIFFDYWECDAAAVLTPRHQGISLWTGLALLAAADGIPVMTYGVGVGPLRTADGALLAKAAFQIASEVTVRDTASRHELAALGLPDEAVTVTGDPALGVTTTPVRGAGEQDTVLPVTDASSLPLLGVALREWDTGVDPGEWAAALAAAVDQHLEHTGGGAVFVPCHRPVSWPLTDDPAAARAVIEHMTHADRATVLPVDQPWQRRAEALAGCDTVLAMRYHAALFALRAGVRTVGLNYDPKVAGLFADWGLPGMCLELADAAKDPQRLAGLLAGEPAAGAPPDLVTGIWVGGSRLLRREHRGAALAAGLLATPSGSATDPAGSAPAPSRDAVRQLLSRMAATAGERPAEITAALQRLADRIGGVPARRGTVAILTNRLLDRDTGEVRIGGAERYALALARLLRDLGLDPVFYQGGGNWPVGDFFGFPVHPIPFGEELSEFQVGIGEEFHRRTADADHVLYLMPNYASGPMRDDAVVVSHGVWWDHELWPHLRFRTPAWQAHLERVFGRARRVISVDVNTINVVRALFPAAAARMRHIPSAVDTTVFHPPVQRAEGEPLVLFPRRADAIRGPQLVGDILDLVPDPCRFRWVGDGDPGQVARLREAAARDGRLTVGDATFEEMPELHRQADICVIPTVGSEGQSLSCLEAMASGAAVVVTRVGGLPELVTDGVDGLVCDPTAESLAAAVRRLVRDPQLRARLGAAARATAERHGEDGWRAAWAEQLADLGWVDRTAAAAAVPYDVINFSIIDWEQRYQRPQQLATHWGRRGRRVFYLRVNGHLPPDGPPYQVTPLAENVFEVRLALPPGLDLHFAVEPDGWVPAVTAALDALRSGWGIGRAVSVVELGTWGPAAGAARRTFGWPVLYDCMDNWSTFPGFADRAGVLARERELVATADAMVVSSRTIQRHWAAARPDAVLARNAADVEFFAGAGDLTGAAADPAPSVLQSARNDAHSAGRNVVTGAVPEPIADVTGPVAGFFGAVVEWFDVALVHRVATARPDVTFVFVGGIARVSLEALEGLPNVRFLGHRPYEEMPGYLRRFDVCLVPFTVSAVTDAMDLVKLYEYLSQGKPVVSTPLREVAPYARYLYLAYDPDEFAAQLDRALLEDDPEAVRRRITLARLNSWDDRLDVFERTLLPILSRSGAAGSADRPSPDLSSPDRVHAGLGEHPAGPDTDALAAQLAQLRAEKEGLDRSRVMRVVRGYWRARAALHERWHRR
jgi:glycosyltransferase involved in cell wall biosynthesis/polysaccharide pyruvyl transferase WcaK-like protein